jgi:hypothetical protein
MVEKKAIFTATPKWRIGDEAYLNMYNAGRYRGYIVFEGIKLLGQEGVPNWYKRVAKIIFIYDDEET